MLRKTLKYKDYNEQDREEDFHFNLSKAEVLEMEVSVDGGLTGLLTNIVQTKNTKEIMRVFKEIMLKAYGEKSADGKQFMKVDGNGNFLYVNFMQTEAYSDYLMLLATDAEAGIEFVNGIMPKVPNPPPAAK